MVMAICASVDAQKLITVRNDSPRPRREVVEVAVTEKFKSKLKKAGKILLDGKGRPQSYQISSDGKLLILTDIPANGEVSYKIGKGEMPQDTMAKGRIYPERLDDIAWENDRIAFRTYGPALQRTGGRAYGYDVLTKRTDRMVLDKWYATMLDAENNRKRDSLRRIDKAAAWEFEKTYSYHFDHGEGLDCYAVGPTLGCGSAALITGETMHFPNCYVTCEVMENGPIRFRAKLTYSPTEIKGTEVREIRILTLDAASQLNHVTVTYEGLKEETTVVAGPACHSKDGGTYAANKEEGYVAHADPSERPKDDVGPIFVGAVFPLGISEAKYVSLRADGKAQSGAYGHVLGYGATSEAKPFEYYWGAGWIKFGFADFTVWEEYLKRFAADLREPLRVTVKL